MSFTANLVGGPLHGEQIELQAYEPAILIADHDDLYSDPPSTRKGMYAATRSAARAADEDGPGGDYEWQGWR